MERRHSARNVARTTRNWSIGHDSQHRLGADHWSCNDSKRTSYPDRDPAWFWTQLMGTKAAASWLDEVGHEPASEIYLVGARALHTMMVFGGMMITGLGLVF
jgi:hypothetical protein